MPVPLITIIGIGLAIGMVGAAGSVSAVAIHQKRAKKKLRSNPTGIPRPPPGMTRSDLKKAAQEKLGMNVIDYYNFVLCGRSGAGKSTLINALLNREDVDFVEGKSHNMLSSAPTGIWQTTKETLCYAYPDGHDLKRVRLWDMPGCGTHDHPSANYFQDKALLAFDVLIVVIENELSEYEYMLLKDAQQQKIPIVIVVTKVEDKVESKIRKKFNSRRIPLQHYEELVKETIEEARQRLFLCLQKLGLENTPIFIVSAWKYRDFMMDQESLAQTEHQETIRRQCNDEILSKQACDQDDNDHNAGNYQANHQNIVSAETHTKNALLSFELHQLLEYIAETAVQRRL